MSSQLPSAKPVLISPGASTQEQVRVIPQRNTPDPTPMMQAPAPGLDKALPHPANPAGALPVLAPAPYPIPLPNPQVQPMGTFVQKKDVPLTIDNAAPVGGSLTTFADERSLKGMDKKEIEDSIIQLKQSANENSEQLMKISKQLSNMSSSNQMIVEQITNLKMEVDWLKQERNSLNNKFSFGPVKKEDEYNSGPLLPTTLLKDDEKLVVNTKEPISSLESQSAQGAYLLPPFQPVSQAQTTLLTQMNGESFKNMPEDAKSKLIDELRLRVDSLQQQINFHAQILNTNSSAFGKHASTVCKIDNCKTCRDNALSSTMFTRHPATTTYTTHYPTTYQHTIRPATTTYTSTTSQIQAPLAANTTTVLPSVGQAKANITSTLMQSQTQATPLAQTNVKTTETQTQTTTQIKLQDQTKTETQTQEEQKKTETQTISAAQAPLQAKSDVLLQAQAPLKTQTQTQTTYQTQNYLPSRTYLQPPTHHHTLLQPHTQFYGQAQGVPIIRYSHRNLPTTTYKPDYEYGTTTKFTTTELAPKTINYSIGQSRILGELPAEEKKLQSFSYTGPANLNLSSKAYKDDNFLPSKTIIKRFDETPAYTTYAAPTITKQTYSLTPQARTYTAEICTKPNCLYKEKCKGDCMNQSLSSQTKKTLYTL